MTFNYLRKAWAENKSLLVFITLMFVFRSAIADWNEVPTGSMKPTIIEGDRILVNKMAYDLRLPFTHVSLYKRADPKRGDIIVFDSEAAGKRLVKRVVGMPGDRVAMRKNTLLINDVPVALELSAMRVDIDGSATDEGAELMENLLGVEHLIWIKTKGSVLSSFAATMVPPGFYLALGDNRDNSADSRVIGLVPRTEIVGRTRSLVISLNYDNYYLPRASRYLQVL
ncbi:MAG: signal peptidase I [Pseudomonadales bacterium]